MKIIGLDIATNTGFVIIENYKIIDRGTISLNSKMDLSQRLRYFSIELSRILDKYKPEWAFLEDVLLGMSGAKTLAYLARLNGVALNTCFTYVKDNVKLFQPSYWKANSFVGLTGSATKWEVQLKVCQYFDIKLESKFQTSFSVRQDTFIRELQQCKASLESKRKLVARYKTDLIRKRNPLTDLEKEELKLMLQREESFIIEIKQKYEVLEKDLDKYMNKICVDISAQTGISSDIADACGIAICGLKEINKETNVVSN